MEGKQTLDGQGYLPLTETSQMNFSGIASQRLKRHRAQSKLEFKGHSKHKVSTKSMRVRELNSKTNRKVTGF